MNAPVCHTTCALDLKIEENKVNWIFITRTYLSQSRLKAQQMSPYTGAILKAQRGFEPGSLYPRGIGLSTQPTGLPRQGPHVFSRSHWLKCNQVTLLPSNLSFD